MLFATLVNAQQTISTKNDTETVQYLSEKMIYNDRNPIDLISNFKISQKEITWYSEFPKSKEFKDLEIKGKTVIYTVTQINIQNKITQYSGSDGKNKANIILDKNKSLIVIEDLSGSKTKISFPLKGNK